MVKLDIGSGMFPAKPLDEWLHLDPDPNAIHVEYRASATNLPLEDGSVDQIRMSHVIEHIGFLDSVKTALLECNRVLSDKGTLEITCPDVSVAAKEILTGDPDRINVALRSIHGEVFSTDNPFQAHHISFTADMLRTVLEQTGFKKVSVWSEPSNSELHAVAFKSVNPVSIEEVKLAFSVLSAEQLVGPWQIIADEITKSGIDAVQYTYDDELPADINSRIELFRGGPWDCMRRSPAFLYCCWVEVFSDTLEWFTQLQFESRSESVDLFIADSPTNATWLRSMTNRPVIICPPGYDSNMFKLISRTDDRPFTFLFVTSPDDRTGAWEVPRAFKLAFPSRPDVRLMIVSGGNRGYVKTLQEQYSNDSRIVIDTTRYSHNRMPEIFAQADVLVRPACSDCVSTSTLEGMATGLPLIAPRHLWFRDYLPTSGVFFVRLTGSTIEPDGRGYKPFSGHWRVPDEGDLAQKMKEAFMDVEFTKAKGLILADYVKQMFSWESISGRMVRFFSNFVEHGYEYLEQIESDPMKFSGVI